MELDRVKLLKEAYMQEATRPDGSKSTLGEYMRLCLDGGLDLVTSKDLVVFDDDNEMAHAVCINEDMKSQASYPVKIISTEYAIIQQIETIMSQENFEKFLENGFFNISNEKKQAMIKWTRGIKNQAQQPMEAEPYFNTNPTIIPMAHSRKEREPISTISTVTGVDGTVRKYATAKEALADLRDGDTVALKTDLVIEEGETVFVDGDISVSVDLGGNTVTSTGVAFGVKGGTLTLTNGTINSTGIGVAAVSKNGIPANINLGEDVVINSTGDCCLYTNGKNIITTGATMSSVGPYCTITGNGNDTSEGTINITGGKIYGDGVAIYIPGNTIVNISGGEIQAATAAYIKSGTINITGGKFIGTGEATAYKYNGSGCNYTGDALVIDSCDYPAGNPKVAINGGEFISHNAKAYNHYDKNGNENPEAYAEDVVISGGVFNTEPYANNLAEGASIIHDPNNNTYSVSI